MLNVQMRRPSDGLPHLLAALETNPQNPDYWLGYLEALLLAGQTDDAKETLALGLQHGLAGAATLDFAKRLEARLSQPTAKELPATPTSPPESPKLRRADRRRDGRLAQKQEGALLATLRQGNAAAALAQARTLTDRFPERGAGWKIFGALLWAQGSPDEALAAMQTAAHLMPQDAETHYNLGTTLIKFERFEEAETCLKRALEIDPGFAAPHARLGNVYQLQGRNAEAEASIRSAISLRPDDAAAYDELGFLLWLKGENEPALSCIRRSIEINPDNAHGFSNLLVLLSQNPAADADSLFAEHCRFGEYFETQLRAFWPVHSNSPDPDRCLQVGLVSGDLYNHAVANFIEPVLARLSHYPGVELHAYYNNATEDNVTLRLRGHVKHWHRVSALSDIELVKQIMDDHIDILIDLSGHSALHRLLAFARKPAPIQASWIGYPGTTGLRAMDYFLADRHFLPPGQFDRYFTEKLVYLPAQAPFQPYASAPPVNALPALATGSITFGSFNRINKINAATIALWSELLRALPQAKMIIAGIPQEVQHNKLIDQFAAENIAPDRLTFHPRCSMDSYLALHHQVDICLDTYPYTGGTTGIHAVWMGVPTLTVAGPTPAARQGAAILSQVGLDGFTATDVADFVAKGLHWASHLSALAGVREGLRRSLQQSPSRQADAIAAALEHALRHMWRRWCANLPAESFHSSAPESTSS
jgi:predicted O-linked N-acetylglucosamine transferase (SPINDLY family)